MYRVTVKPDYRWTDCQIAGRIFSKNAVVEIADADLSEEIKTADILQIEQVKEAVSEPTPEEPVKTRTRKAA